MRTWWIGAVVVLMLATGCKRTNSIGGRASIDPNVVEDGSSAPRVFGNLQSMRYEALVRDDLRQGVLDTQPWSGDFWPWIQAGLARRWMLPERMFKIDVAVDAPRYREDVQDEISAFLGFAQRAEGATRWRLSPLEKYDLIASEGFPLTTKELFDYARYKKYFEENDIPWAWMGSCDGWATAARLLPAPLYPVLASVDRGAPMLFTVGDIRGLVSKAFTDNYKSTEPDVFGTRCEKRPEDIIRDARGRIVDGAIGTWTGDALADSRNIWIVYNNWRLGGYQELGSSENVIVFRYLDHPDKLYWLRAVGWTDRQDDIVRVEVRPVPDDRLDPSVPPTLTDFEYLASCRDLNAGAFHLVLAQLLSRGAATRNGGARGFVIEMARAQEVWNQPIYGYLTRLGEPLDLQAVAPDGPQDPYAAYRAPGTRYLVHVYTTILFGVESGPFVIYEEKDNLLARITYQYVLELDANGYVIGGEWHRTVDKTADQLTPLSGTALLRFLGEQIGTAEELTSPDFIWRYAQGTRLLDECREPPCLSTQIIYGLAACSRKTPQEGDTVRIQGQTVPFVRCALPSPRPGE